MKESNQFTLLYLVLLIVFLFPTSLSGQLSFDKSEIHFYEKKEINWGTQFHFNKEREELLTDNSIQYEELSVGELKFTLENIYWKLLDFKQEQLEFDFEVGPILGNGLWNDSSYFANTFADQSIFGLRFNGAINYLYRYYYNNKIFTLLHVYAKGKYDLYQRNSTGVLIDSVGYLSDFDIISNRTKLRYGFSARAGWGFGRLNPVNHLMVADYLFDKYYSGRTFSKEERDKIIKEIENIKNNRTILTGHDNVKEAEQFIDFVNQQIFLIRPKGFDNEWKYGEFVPRYSGSRVEMGPFFNYYNREPDFIYGGYVQFENEKYCNYKWNRNFNAGLNYNWYKKQDWILAKVDLGWSYFARLRSQFDFGISYVPVVILNCFEDIGKLNHAFVPYFGYYYQINETARVNLAFAYRIANNEELMLHGPEFSIFINKSRY